ncbi:MAG: OsmC family protein [Egibacteraceae bacterium]
MRRDELRAVQAPLKERYRGEPAAALVTLRAEGVLGEGITCSVKTGAALASAGLHPATGGDGLSLCSGDMLLEALAACAGVTLSSVATALEIPLRGGTVHVEGDLDFRGTLAVSKEAPVGFRDIRVRFELDADATPDQLARLLALTERYCVVHQTLQGSATLTVSHELVGDAAAGR